VRGFFWLLLLFFCLAMAVAFAAMNPGSIDLDLGFAAFHLQKSLAFTLAFVAGFAFGLLCLSVILLRASLERRRLAKALRLAEAEIHALRSQPAPHAD